MISFSFYGSSFYDLFHEGEIFFKLRKWLNSFTEYSYCGQWSLCQAFYLKTSTWTITYLWSLSSKPSDFVLKRFTSAIPELALLCASCVSSFWPVFSSRGSFSLFIFCFKQFLVDALSFLAPFTLISPDVYESDENEWRNSDNPGAIEWETRVSSESPINPGRKSDIHCNAPEQQTSAEICLRSVHWNV